MFTDFCIVAIGLLMGIQVEGKVSLDLVQEFAKAPSSTRDIVINFKHDPTEIIRVFGRSGRAVRTEEERNQLHAQMLTELQDFASDSQRDVRAFMQGEALEAESCWVTNQIFIKGADKNLVEALKKFDNVAEIRKEQVFQIHNPIIEGPLVEEVRGDVLGGPNPGVKAIPTIEWNVQKINAPQVWATGNKGKGVKVGVIDTGIRQSHAAFASNALVDWFDAVNKKKTAYDDNGHGTHVCGTLVGTTGTGVAPEASLLVCKACDKDGACVESSLNSCGQWMLQKQPNLVSNSWGGSKSNSFYSPVTKAWLTNNILPVFSAGNSGPECKTGGSPGDYMGVLSVGASNSTNSIAKFSSRGEGPNGINPSVTAPGQSIKSAWPTSDTAYNTISGTSMACPHVSGLAALMFASSPGITAEAVRATILKSCDTTNLADTNQSCGGTPSTTFPNNVYGHGLIDSVRATQTLKPATESKGIIQIVSSLLNPRK